MRKYTKLIKSFLIVNVILIIIIIFYFASSKNKNVSLLTIALLSNPESAAEIQLGTDIKLIKKNDEWFLAEDDNNYPIYQSQVSEMLQLLGGLIYMEPVAVTKASIKEINFESVKSVRIFNANKKIICSFDLGKYAEAEKKVYIQLTENKKIGLVPSNIASYILTGPNSWLMLDVIKTRLNVNDIEQVIINDMLSKANNIITITRKNHGWIINNKNEATLNTKVESFMRYITSIKASNYLPNTSKIGDAKFTIEIHMGNASAIHLYFSQSLNTSNGYICTTSDSNYIMLVPKQVITDIIDACKTM